MTEMSFAWGDAMPRLTAARIVLRPLESRDVAALFEVFSDPQVTRYWSSPPLRDMSAAGGLLQDIRDHFERKTLFQWGVARQVDDVVIGTCTLCRLEAEHGRAEVGFALGRRHWGRGMMTEALGALVRFAFEQLGLHRLEADTDPRNTPSVRCLERQGFRLEGHLRQRYRLGGELQDALVFGLLRHEWEQTEATRAAHRRP